MITLVFFGTALLAIFSFLLFMFFRILAIAVGALFASIETVFLVGGLAFMAGMALFFIYGVELLIDMVGVGNLISSSLAIVGYVIGIIACVCVFGGLGVLIFMILAGNVFSGCLVGLGIVTSLISAIPLVLHKVADIFEKGYKKCIGIITDNLEKC